QARAPYFFFHPLLPPRPAHLDPPASPTRRSSDLLEDRGVLDRRTVPRQRQPAGLFDTCDGDRDEDGARRMPLLLGRTSHAGGAQDRKSTRLNSSHVKISYAVFCLKKKIEGKTQKL